VEIDESLVIENEATLVLVRDRACEGEHLIFRSRTNPGPSEQVRFHSRPTPTCAPRWTPLPTSGNSESTNDSRAEP
jgi:hypothetical protein